VSGASNQSQKKQRQCAGNGLGLDRFCADIDQALTAVREMK
jgi:hypothetical protein